MSIPETIVGIIIALIVAGFGMFVSGIVYDALWSAGDTFHNIVNCNTLQDGWDNLCEAEKAKYERGKKSIQLISGIAPFVGILLFFIYRI